MKLFVVSCMVLILILGVAGCVDRNTYVERSELFNNIIRMQGNEYYQTMFVLGRIDEVYNLLTDGYHSAKLDDELVVLYARTCLYLGKCDEAEGALLSVCKRCSIDNHYRLDSEMLLLDLYYRQNRFDLAYNLFAGIPEKPDLYYIMIQFKGTNLYRIIWDNNDFCSSVPFIYTEDSALLPYIDIMVNGRVIRTYIDTGADQLSLTLKQSEELGLDLGVATEGVYAGGRSAISLQSIVEEVRIGEVTIKNVPVSIVPESSASLGTSILRQFTPTLDYRGQRLILHKRGIDVTRELSGMNHTVLDEIPFGFTGTHYMFVHGRINNRNDLHLFVDSGLESSSAFACPLPTLNYLGIDKPFLLPIIGQGGSGRELYWVGQFDVASIAIGGLVQENHTGLYGIFPEELYFAKERIGFIVDGIVSHSFLNDYSWTIDFDQQVMYFSN